MSEFVLLYVTLPDLQSARTISETLLQARLVACTNVLPGMESTYWWDGKIETSKEVVLILKTLRTLANATRTEVLKIHPYEIPCILELEINEANPTYAQWMREAVTTAPKK